MYNVIVFLHVAGVFGFLLAHGAAMNMAFRLRQLGREPVTDATMERARALLDLSQSSSGLLYGSLVVLLLAGIAAGFMGSWWGRGWIWASIIILVLTIVLMYVRGSNFYLDLRAALGMPDYRKKNQPPAPPKSAAEIQLLLQSPRVFEVTTIGVISLLLLLALMIFKPF